TFEEMMKQRNVKEIKVLQEKLTEKAKSFIESFGFTSEDEEYVKKI
ncbi:GNAT family N-acetyltransferase, partial [Bacillus sp. HC-Mk]